MDHRAYFRAYRAALGFSNQAQAKQFLSGKDIQPGIDLGYISQLNDRLVQIIETIDETIWPGCRQENLDRFCQSRILEVYEQVQRSGLLARLNNQGRRPEQVLFSWLRGYAIAEYMRPAFGLVFDVDPDKFRSVGDDDFTSLETFRRTPRADFEIAIRSGTIILEIQSGYQGINDIKQHKVLEARNQFGERGKPTICVHVDTFNGQVAFVRLDQIEENDINWITRQQMEGQTVFNIDQGFFAWRIMDKPPSFDTLDLNL